MYRITLCILRLHSLLNGVILLNTLVCILLYKALDISQICLQFVLIYDAFTMMMMMMKMMLMA